MRALFRPGKSKCCFPKIIACHNQRLLSQNRRRSQKERRRKDPASNEIRLFETDSDFESAAGQHRLEACFIDGLDVGVARLDDSFLNEIEKRVVEKYHAVLFPGLHR